MITLLPPQWKITALGLKPQGNPSAFLLSHLSSYRQQILLVLSLESAHCPLLGHNCFTQVVRWYPNFSPPHPLSSVHPPLCTQMDPVKRLIVSGHSSVQNLPIAPTPGKSQNSHLSQRWIYYPGPSFTCTGPFQGPESFCF